MKHWIYIEVFMMKRRQKNRLEKSRYEIVKTWLSSFVVTAVVIVSVIVFIPKSPVASIVKYVALENQVTYQVIVTDEDYALDSNSLKIVIENQLERYESLLTLGENSGVFHHLKANTDYQLSVYGSKGFGLERLDSVKLRTKPRIGGFILNYRVYQEPHGFSYEVDTFINDPNHEYTQITLFYGYTYDGQAYYDDLPITSIYQTLELFYLHSKTHLYLEATTLNGTVILDEMWITPPFQLQSSFYIDYIDSNEIGYHLYHNQSLEVQVQYRMDLYEGNKIVRTQTMNADQISYDGELIIFKNLKEETNYQMIVTASYMNPDTRQMNQVVIFEEEANTLGYYQIEIATSIFETYMVVTLTVIDPSHYFQVPYLDVYDVSGEYELIIFSESYSFTPGIDQKTVTITINYPSVKDYRVVIGVRNSSNYIIRHIVYDETTHKG